MPRLFPCHDVIIDLSHKSHNAPVQYPKMHHFLTDIYDIKWCIWGICLIHCGICEIHDDVIKRNHFPRYWPFVRGIHRSPVNSPHKGQCRGPLMFTLICARINGWVNNREAGYLRRNRAHYDVIVMSFTVMTSSKILTLPLCRNLPRS